MFTFLSGLAGSAFVFFWLVCVTGVAKANNIAVHQPLLADNYPIGIRARMSAAMNIGQQVLGNLSPVVVGAIATWAGGVEGWRWAFFVLGIPGAIVAFAAFFMKEPPRGQYEKQDVLGEVIEDENPMQPSMEAAFARLKKIATIRTSIAAFAALGFGVFALGGLQVLYLNDTLHVTNMLHRGFILSLVGLDRGAVPLSGRPLLRPHVPQEPGQGARARRAADPAVGDLHAAAGLDAQHRRGS